MSDIALNYLDCNGFCLNDNDINPTNLNLMGDGICDEVDNCPATTFNNLIRFVFKFMNKKQSIEYIDIEC